MTNQNACVVFEHLQIKDLLSDVANPCIDWLYSN